MTVVTVILYFVFCCSILTTQYFNSKICKLQNERAEIWKKGCEDAEKLFDEIFILYQRQNNYIRILHRREEIVRNHIHNFKEISPAMTKLENELGMIVPKEWENERS